MSLEPDVPDDDGRDTAGTDPGAAVDDLEDAVVDRPEGDTPDPVEDDDPPKPAFEVDLDPEDQGKAETAAANPD